MAPTPASGPTNAYSGLLAPTTCQEAGVAIARVTRMKTPRGNVIPHRLGDLPPALHVRGSPPRRRISIILPREGADRGGPVTINRRRLSVSRDFTGERGTSTDTHNGGCTDCSAPTKRQETPTTTPRPCSKTAPASARSIEPDFAAPKQVPSQRLNAYRKTALSRGFAGEQSGNTTSDPGAARGIFMAQGGDENGRRARG